MQLLQIFRIQVCTREHLYHQCSDITLCAYIAIIVQYAVILPCWALWRVEVSLRLQYSALPQTMCQMTLPHTSIRFIYRPTLHYTLAWQLDFVIILHQFFLSHYVNDFISCYGLYYTMITFTLHDNYNDLISCYGLYYTLLLFTSYYYY